MVGRQLGDEGEILCVRCPTTVQDMDAYSEPPRELSMQVVMRNRKRGVKMHGLMKMNENTGRWQFLCMLDWLTVLAHPATVNLQANWVGE